MNDNHMISGLCVTEGEHMGTILFLSRTNQHADIAVLKAVSEDCEYYNTIQEFLAGKLMHFDAKPYFNTFGRVHCVFVTDYSGENSDVHMRKQIVKSYVDFIFEERQQQIIDLMLIPNIIEDCHVYVFDAKNKLFWKIKLKIDQEKLNDYIKAIDKYVSLKHSVCQFEKSFVLESKERFEIFSKFVSSSSENLREFFLKYGKHDEKFWERCHPNTRRDMFSYILKAVCNNISNTDFISDKNLCTVIQNSDHSRLSVSETKNLKQVLERYVRYMSSRIQNCTFGSATRKRRSGLYRTMMSVLSRYSDLSRHSGATFNPERPGDDAICAANAFFNDIHNSFSADRDVESSINKLEMTLGVNAEDIVNSLLKLVAKYAESVRVKALFTHEAGREKRSAFGTENVTELCYYIDVIATYLLTHKKDECAWLTRERLITNCHPAAIFSGLLPISVGVMLKDDLEILMKNDQFNSEIPGICSYTFLRCYSNDKYLMYKNRKHMYGKQNALDLYRDSLCLIETKIKNVLNNRNFSGFLYDKYGLIHVDCNKINQDRNTYIMSRQKGSILDNNEVWPAVGDFSHNVSSEDFLNFIEKFIREMSWRGYSSRKNFMSFLSTILDCSTPELILDLMFKFSEIHDLIETEKNFNKEADIFYLAALRSIAYQIKYAYDFNSNNGARYLGSVLQDIQDRLETYIDEYNNFTTSENDSKSIHPALAIILEAILTRKWIDTDTSDVIYHVFVRIREENDVSVGSRYRHNVNSIGNIRRSVRKELHRINSKICATLATILFHIDTPYVIDAIYSASLEERLPEHAMTVFAQRNRLDVKLMLHIASAIKHTHINPTTKTESVISEFIFACNRGVPLSILIDTCFSESVFEAVKLLDSDERHVIVAEIHAGLMLYSPELLYISGSSLARRCARMIQDTINAVGSSSYEKYLVKSLLEFNIVRFEQTPAKKLLDDELFGHDTTMNHNW